MEKMKRGRKKKHTPKSNLKPFLFLYFLFNKIFTFDPSTTIRGWSLDNLFPSSIDDSIIFLAISYRLIVKSCSVG